MARPKAKVPVRLEVHYEHGEDSGLKRALTVLAAMLRDSANGGARPQERGNSLPGSNVTIEESLR